MIALAVAAIFGSWTYGLRLYLVRDPDQMRRFLDRHFEGIRRKWFWRENRNYIDESMIKSDGLIGLGFIPLPAFYLSMKIDHFSLNIEQLWSIGALASICLLFIAGRSCGDALAGIHFLRALGVNQVAHERVRSTAPLGFYQKIRLVALLSLAAVVLWIAWRRF